MKDQSAPPGRGCRPVPCRSIGLVPPHRGADEREREQDLPPSNDVGKYRKQAHVLELRDEGLSGHAVEVIEVEHVVESLAGGPHLALFEESSRTVDDGEL